MLLIARDRAERDVGRRILIIAVIASAWAATASGAGDELGFLCCKHCVSLLRQFDVEYAALALAATECSVCWTATGEMNPAAAAMAHATGMVPNPRVQNAFSPLGPIRSKGCSAFDEAGIWSIGCEVVSDPAELAAARALHDELGPLIDGHNDLPWAMRKYVGYDLEKLDIAEDQSPLQESGKIDLQTDIPRLQKGGVGGQFWSVFVPTPADTSPESPGSSVAVQQTLENIDFVHNMVAKYPETFHYCEKADDADAAFVAGKISSFIGMEVCAHTCARARVHCEHLDRARDP